MFTIWVIFHVIVCAGLVIVVLLQSSKGEGLAGSAFGGGGGGLSGAVFGGRGAASFLSKATTVLAVVFMLNCGALAYMSAGTRGASSGTGQGVEVDSPITNRAQQEREQALQRQQQAQQADSTVSLDELTGQTAPADSSGN